MTQEAAIEVIKIMPHDFNINELIERLVVIQKIDEAEKDVEEGKVYTHSEMLNMIAEWKK